MRITFRRSAILVSLGIPALVLGCGESPSAPEPVATTLTATAGDGQSSPVSTQLSTALTVTVLDEADAALAGATVTWSVTTGGGSVSAAQITTAADGTASTTWTLGTLVGTQSVRAAVGTLTVDFSATGEAVAFMPAADMTVSGTLEATTVTIPSGVTVTMSDDAVINASGAVVLDGSLVGDCVSMGLTGSAALTVTGTVRNVCESADADTRPALSITTSGAITMIDAVIESSGEITIGNVPGTSGAAPSHLAAQTAEAPACTYTGTTVASTGRGRPGTEGDEEAGSGGPGAPIGLFCRGTLIVEGGSLSAQPGGDGGHFRCTGCEFAEGGHGGSGGDIVISSEGQEIIFRESDGEAVVLTPGSGGDGGFATNTFGPTASGGNGGRVGLPLIRSSVITIETAGALVLAGSIVRGGHGGNAVASGGPGADATGGSPARVGDASTAYGGQGGPVGLGFQSTDDLLIGTEASLLAASSIVNPEYIDVPDGFFQAGNGGTSRARGGNGGNGDALNVDGAASGETTSQGGVGGGITFADNRGATLLYVGVPGDGGSAFFGAEGAGVQRGGNGFNGCLAEGGPVAGGTGGDAGAIFGFGGLDGTVGRTPGVTRAQSYLTDIGNGGAGGSGDEPGAGGSAADQLGVSNPKDESGQTFEDGADGTICPGAQPPFESFIALLGEGISGFFGGSEGTTPMVSVARTDGATVATADGDIVAEVSATGSGTFYGGVIHSDNGIKIHMVGPQGIYGSTTDLPEDVPVDPVGISLERIDWSIENVTDNNGNTTDGVAFGNDPESDGAVYAQFEDGNVLVVRRDGGGTIVPDPTTAHSFKPGGVSVFGDDRPVSAYADYDGFTSGKPMIVVTEAALDQAGKLWRVDLVDDVAVPTEITTVSAWEGPRRVRCLMPQGICAVAAFGGSGFGSFGGLSWFTWDGGANVEPAPGFSSVAGDYLGIDLAAWGDDVALVAARFSQNKYEVYRLDSTTGLSLEADSYDVPEECVGPGHVTFRPRPGGTSPTEVLISCNTSGNVVAVPLTGPGS